MKTATLGFAAMAMLSSLAVACPCANPLDATADQYLAVDQLVNPQYAAVGQFAPPTPIPFPVIVNQTASFNIAPTPQGEVHYVALNKAGTNAVLHGLGGNITLPTSGIVGFEMRVDNFPKRAMSQPGDTILYVIAVGGGAYRFRLGLTDIVSGTYSYYGTEYNGAFTSSSLTASMAPVALPLGKGFRVGVYFNMTTRQVGYTVNGVDHGYIADHIPADVTEITLGLGADNFAQAGDKVIGNQVGGTLITSAHLFTQPFPAGTRDVCGDLMP